MKVLSTYLHTLRRFKHFNTSEAAGIHGTLRLVQSKSDNRKENPVLFIWQQPDAREQAGTPKRLISSVPLPEEKAGCT